MRPTPETMPGKSSPEVMGHRSPAPPAPPPPLNTSRRNRQQRRLSSPGRPYGSLFGSWMP